MSQLEELHKKFGKNSNSFLALYPGYQYFYLEDPSQGCIAYLPTRLAWVGLAEPLGSTENQRLLLKAFEAEAARVGKSVVLLPVEAGFKESAELMGFRSFQIGSEPYFELNVYPPRGRDWLDVSRSAKSLRFSKHFSVREFTIEDATRALRLEMGQILQDWIESRKTGELGFVNRVEPYTLSQFKKYFLVEGQGRIWAFMACVPIWGEQGWYFIDVVRRKDSPAGSVELLFLEAMKELKSQGSKWVSLGVSPLARLEIQASSNDSLVAKLVPVFFKRFQWFYSFRSLYNFKSKFQPSQWRAAYVIHNFSKTDQRLFSVLTEVFLPQGTFTAFIQMISKKLDLREYFNHISGWICERVILRSSPKGPLLMLSRMRISILLILTWIVCFATIRDVDSSNSFSFESMKAVNSFSGLWSVFGLPGFLHWNIFHLILNLVTFLMVGITLEISVGGALLAICYCVGHLLANGLTALLIWFLVQIVPLQLLVNALLTQDVGASLGIWSCAGAWSYLLRKRSSVWMIFPGAVLFVGTLRGDIFQINHIVAAALGLGVARIYFGKIHYEKA